jgi:hypothetical protein
MRRLAWTLILCGACGSTSKPPAAGSDAARADAAIEAGTPPPPVDAPAADRSVDARPDFGKPTGDPALLAIAGNLHGAFIEVDCASEEIEFQFCVPVDMGVQDLKLKFGGEAGKRYAVVLKVWGVVEGILYSGGKRDGEHFYIGGQSTTPMTATYGLQAGDQTYYFNHFDLGAGEHYTYSVTYQTMPITIAGASTLVFFVHSPDNIINTNHMQNEVMDPTPALQERLDWIQSGKLQGQFLYVEVASAKLAP